MPRKVKTAYVGAFALIGLSLLIGFLVWIGLARFFEEHKTYVTYFDESVKGLQKDAVVNYRGVPVGRVGSIGIAPDGRLIEVVLHLKPDLVVDKNVVVRLREQGITGLRFLEIDKAPEDVEQLSPVINFTPPYPVIRSYPSEFALLKKNLETLYSRVESLNVEGLVAQWSGLAKDLRNTVAKEELIETIKALRLFSHNLSELSENLKAVADRKRLENYVTELDKLLKEARIAVRVTAQKADSLDVASINKAVKEANDLMAGTQRMMETVNTALTAAIMDLRITLEQLNMTIEDLRTEPSRLITTPRKLEPFEDKR